MKSLKEGSRENNNKRRRVLQHISQASAILARILQRDLMFEVSLVI